MGYFDSLTEKLSGREVVGLLIVVFAMGCLAYVADQYVYQPCRMPFAGEWFLHSRETLLVFGGLFFIAYLLIGRVRWFSKHIGWLIMVVIVTVLIITALVIGYWCY